MRTDSNVLSKVLREAETLKSTFEKNRVPAKNREDIPKLRNPYSDNSENNQILPGVLVTGSTPISDGQFKSEDILVLDQISSGVQPSKENNNGKGGSKSNKSKLEELEQFMKETLVDTTENGGSSSLGKPLSKDSDNVRNTSAPKDTQIQQTPEPSMSQENYVKASGNIGERSLVVNPMQLLNRPPRLDKHLF